MLSKLGNGLVGEGDADSAVFKWEPQISGRDVSNLYIYMVEFTCSLSLGTLLQLPLSSCCLSLLIRVSSIVHKLVFQGSRASGLFQHTLLDTLDEAITRISTRHPCLILAVCRTAILVFMGIFCKGAKT
ncbi:hypothetical protein XELAEV_18018226mg [Xenopus laevis]|uniref:Uncharacterized protein n=1 Tax=Xenopus laevis TaxID=8355 RepID=A0A974DD67_XENLA|nr:hypothetical protein XELAEV_18018226mg [Xenopus laevis]